ncbi:MAG: cadherin repeat domain-containing protein [Pirellulaceae bacterium]
MTKRRATGLRPINGGGELRPIRLVLEPLEARRLLAGVDIPASCDHSAIASLNSMGSELGVSQQPNALQPPLLIRQFDLLAEGELAEGDFSIPENSAPGTLIGFIDLVDPAYDGNYTIDVADARFSAVGNQLIFTDGMLDFETEPLISFTITIVNPASNLFATVDAKVSVGDVNERPLAIELSGGKVPEHEPGAVVGDLTVVDPDSQSNYAYYLFDSRFVLSGHQLKLADGIELDYETEPVVMLAVAATDGTFEIFDTVRIEVLPTPEAPVLASSVALDPLTLAELTAGAEVGLAAVVNPKNASYQFSVSDERFEMRGNQLKLRDNQQVNALVEPEISLTLTPSVTKVTRLLECSPLASPAFVRHITITTSTKMLTAMAMSPRSMPC